MSEGQGDGALECEGPEGDGGLECEGPEGDGGLECEGPESAEMNTGGSVEDALQKIKGMNLFQLHIF